MNKLKYKNMNTPIFLCPKRSQIMIDFDKFVVYNQRLSCPLPNVHFEHTFQIWHINLRNNM